MVELKKDLPEIFEEFADQRRNSFLAIKKLKEQGVPTAVYYPIPLHLQPAYAHYPRGAGGLPVTERLKDVVVSLPMHSDLDAATQDRVIAAVASFKG